MAAGLNSKRKNRIRNNKMFGVVRGLLSAFSAEGYPVVDCYINPSREPIPALSSVRLTTDDVGREVVLMFEDGDVARPIVIGLVQAPLGGGADDERLDLTASAQMTLRCGKASLTLTKAGKVLIRGEYVSTTSSGVNCIKGGAVRIN